MIELTPLYFIENVLIPIIIALIASSSFWLWIGKRRDRKSFQTELLIGLAHDRIVYLGMKYIERGWISQDEYENLTVYLFKAYNELGGNGSARRIMVEVDKLPIKKTIVYYKGEKPNVIHEQDV